MDFNGNYGNWRCGKLFQRIGFRENQKKFTPLSNSLIQDSLTSPFLLGNANLLDFKSSKEVFSDFQNLTNPKMSNQKHFPFLILILLALVWGSSFILIKRGLDSFSAGQVGSLRIVFSFLFMIPWAIKVFKQNPERETGSNCPDWLVRKSHSRFLVRKSRNWLGKFHHRSFEWIDSAFYFHCRRLGFRWRDESWAIGRFAFRFCRHNWVEFYWEQMDDLGQMNYYALLVVLASVCYALSANILKSKLQNLRPIEITAMAMAIIGPFALIYLFATDFLDRLQTQELAWQSLGYMAILGIVGTAIALIFFNKLIQMTSAVFATSVTYLIPIVAIAWGLLDGEKIFVWHYVGMAFILGGIYLVNKFRD